MPGSMVLTPCSVQETHRKGYMMYYSLKKSRVKSEYCDFSLVIVKEGNFFVLVILFLFIYFFHITKDLEGPLEKKSNYWVKFVGIISLQRQWKLWKVF